MKDLLPAILLIICGLSGLSLVLKKDKSAEDEFLRKQESSGYIYIRAQKDIDGYASSRTRILGKEDIIICGDSIYRSQQ